MSEHELTYDLYVAAPASKVWQAITDGGLTEQYFYGTRFEGKPVAGAAFVYTAGGARMVEGEVVQAEAGRLLVARQRSMWDDKVARDGASTVSWKLTPLGDEACRLEVTQSDFGGETETYRQSAQGWPVVLSGLKTLVETGRPLRLPA